MLTDFVSAKSQLKRANPFIATLSLEREVLPVGTVYDWHLQGELALFRQI